MVSARRGVMIRSILQKKVKRNRVINYMNMYMSNRNNVTNVEINSSIIIYGIETAAEYTKLIITCNLKHNTPQDSMRGGEGGLVNVTVTRTEVD